MSKVLQPWSLVCRYVERVLMKAETLKAAVEVLQMSSGPLNTETARSGLQKILDVRLTQYPGETGRSLCCQNLVELFSSPEPKAHR